MQNTTHDNVILELTVRNHPGVMTHVCGLFARRAFNVEGILCLPIQDSDKSHIWLLVNDDQRLEQMISQIDKLEDVVKVQRNQSDPTMFNKIAVFFLVSDFLAWMGYLHPGELIFCNSNYSEYIFVH